MDEDQFESMVLLDQHQRRRNDSKREERREMGAVRSFKMHQQPNESTSQNDLIDEGCDFEEEEQDTESIVQTPQTRTEINPSHQQILQQAQKVQIRGLQGSQGNHDKQQIQGGTLRNASVIDSRGRIKLVPGSNSSNHGQKPSIRGQTKDDRRRQDTGAADSLNQKAGGLNSQAQKPYHHHQLLQISNVKKTSDQPQSTNSKSNINNSADALESEMQQDQMTHVEKVVGKDGIVTVGNYKLGRDLGKGTFGKVKVGTHLLTGEKVAIKVLEKDKIVDVSDVERVAREIHILKIVRHPVIVQLYEIVETNKEIYLIMEYARGGELFEFIVNRKRVRDKDAAKFLHQILSGIQYLHKLGICHRDLKPENLLMDDYNNIKMVDFGLSNTYVGDEMLKTACGSPCYAAPEMVAGKSYYGLPADIWSCGVILYAMVCGYLPFEDPKTNVLYKKILNADYKIPDFISDECRDLITNILNTDPSKRFTAADIHKHPWYTSCQLKNQKDYQGIIIGKNPIPVDTAILKEVYEKFADFQSKVDFEDAKRDIEQNKHNEVTTTYYLTLKRFLRQGGKSIADITKYHPSKIDSMNQLPNTRLKTEDSSQIKTAAQVVQQQTTASNPVSIKQLTSKQETRQKSNHAPNKHPQTVQNQQNLHLLSQQEMVEELAKRNRIRLGEQQSQNTTSTAKNGVGKESQNNGVQIKKQKPGIVVQAKQHQALLGAGGEIQSKQGNIMVQRKEIVVAENLSAQLNGSPNFYNAMRNSEGERVVVNGNNKKFQNNLVKEVSQMADSAANNSRFRQRNTEDENPLNMLDQEDSNFVAAKKAQNMLINQNESNQNSDIKQREKRQTTSTQQSSAQVVVSHTPQQLSNNFQPNQANHPQRQPNKNANILSMNMGGVTRNNAAPLMFQNETAWQTSVDETNHPQPQPQPSIDPMNVTGAAFNSQLGANSLLQGMTSVAPNTAAGSTRKNNMSSQGAANQIKFQTGHQPANSQQIQHKKFQNLQFYSNQQAAPSSVVNQNRQKTGSLNKNNLPLGLTQSQEDNNIRGLAVGGRISTATDNYASSHMSPHDFLRQKHAQKNMLFSNSNMGVSNGHNNQTSSFGASSSINNQGGVNDHHTRSKFQRQLQNQRKISQNMAATKNNFGIASSLYSSGQQNSATGQAAHSPIKIIPQKAARSSGLNGKQQQILPHVVVLENEARNKSFTRKPKTPSTTNQTNHNNPYNSNNLTRSSNHNQQLNQHARNSGNHLANQLVFANQKHNLNQSVVVNNSSMMLGAQQSPHYNKEIALRNHQNGSPLGITQADIKSKDISYMYFTPRDSINFQYSQPSNQNAQGTNNRLPTKVLAAIQDKNLKILDPLNAAVQQMSTSNNQQTHHQLAGFQTQVRIPNHPNQMQQTQQFGQNQRLRMASKIDSSQEHLLADMLNNSLILSSNLAAPNPSTNVNNYQGGYSTTTTTSKSGKRRPLQQAVNKHRISNGVGGGAQSFGSGATSQLVRRSQMSPQRSSFDPQAISTSVVVNNNSKSNPLNQSTTFGPTYNLLDAKVGRDRDRVVRKAHQNQGVPQTHNSVSSKRNQNLNNGETPTQLIEWQNANTTASSNHARRQAAMQRLSMQRKEEGVQLQNNQQNMVLVNSHQYDGDQKAGRNSTLGKARQLGIPPSSTNHATNTNTNTSGVQQNQQVSGLRQYIQQKVAHKQSASAAVAADNPTMRQTLSRSMNTNKQSNQNQNQNMMMMFDLQMQQQKSFAMAFKANQQMNQIQTKHVKQNNQNQFEMNNSNGNGAASSVGQKSQFASQFANSRQKQAGGSNSAVRYAQVATDQ